MTQPVDLFGGGDKTPSVSFKGATPGTTKVLSVKSAPREQQSRDYDTGKPEFWDDGQPKKIILVEVVENGEDRALWVTPGTSLYAAIKAAQSEAGSLVGPGGVLTVIFTHEIPPKNPKHNNVKQYAATYKGANAFTATPEAAATTQSHTMQVEGYSPTAPAVTMDEAALQALKAAGIDVTALLAK